MTGVWSGNDAQVTLNQKLWMRIEHEGLDLTLDQSSPGTEKDDGAKPDQSGYDS